MYGSRTCTLLRLSNVIELRHTQQTSMSIWIHTNIQELLLPSFVPQRNKCSLVSIWMLAYHYLFELENIYCSPNKMDIRGSGEPINISNAKILYRFCDVQGFGKHHGLCFLLEFCI